MKYVLIYSILFLFISLQVVYANSDTSLFEECMDMAMTQSAMNDCAWEDFKRTQAELTLYFAQIRADANDPEFLKKLDKVQHAWEEFQNAQIELFHYNHGGSVRSMCQGIAAAGLVYHRLEQLKAWTEPSVEGDVCGPTIFDHTLFLENIE